MKKRIEITRADFLDVVTQLHKQGKEVRLKLLSCSGFYLEVDGKRRPEVLVIHSLGWSATTEIDLGDET